MNEDNRKRVYDVLKEQTGYLDSYEDFNKAFDASEDNRKRVYDVLKNQTGYLDSYEDFTKGMSAPATSVAQQVIDEYDQANQSSMSTGAVLNDNSAGSPKIPGYDAVGRLYELMERNKPSLNELVKKNSQDKPESVNDRDTFQTPIYENALRVANRMRKEQAMRSEDYGYRPSIAEPIEREKNTFEQEEERRIDELYHPKKVENESDVLENYRNRFVLSIRGGKLDGELAEKRGEVEAKYLQIFTQSPEYQDLLRLGASAEEINEKFYQQYGDAINGELRPYENAIFQEMANRYRGRIQEEFTQLQKQRSTDQLKALAGEVDELSKQAHKNLQRRAPSSGNAMNALMGSRNYTQSSEEERRQVGMLNAAKRLIEQSQEIVAEAGKQGGTNFVAGLGRGLRDNMDWENFTFGLADMADALYLNNALEKYEAGNTLSEAEQKLLEASAVNMAIQGFYSSDLGRGYNAGRVTAESLPFMLEFIANPISGSSNAIAKSLLKFGLRRFGRFGSFAARVAGSTGAALGMTGTTGVPRVASGTMDRLNQNYDYYLDENGDLQVQKTGNVGTLEAMGKSIASTALEYQSEMVLNAFRVFRPYLRQLEKSLPGGVNSFMQMVKESRPGQLYREVKNNPTLRELVQRTQFQGFPQEYLEEVYNNFSNIPLGDMTLEEATDFDNNLDIILGLTPTFLAFGMIGVGSMATERYQNRKHMERLFGKMTDEQRKKFEELQRMSKINGNEDIKNFIKITMADPELTQEQKRDEIDYAFAIAKQNAIDEIQEAGTQDRIDAETEDIAGHSDPSTNTYTEAERIYMNDVGEWVKEPGHIVGWQDPEKERFPYWIPEGAEFTPENTRLLRPGEWDATTVKSMPTQEVIDETAQAIREDAAAQAQRESTYSPDIVPYNQLEPGRSSFYDKDGNLYSVGNIDTDTKNFMMLVTSPEGKQIASRPFSEEEYLSIRQAQIDAEEQTQQTSQSQDASSGGKENFQPEQTITPQQQEVDALRQAGVDDEVIRNTIADRVKKAKAALAKAERLAKAPIKDAKTVKEEMAARKKALDDARAAYEGWNVLLSSEPVPQVQQTQEDAGARSFPQGSSLASKGVKDSTIEGQNRTQEKQTRENLWKLVSYLNSKYGYNFADEVSFVEWITSKKDNIQWLKDRLGHLYKESIQNLNDFVSIQNLKNKSQAQSDSEIESTNQTSRPLSADEADALLADMESRAEVAPELELTIENWDAQFGADALVQTPIGKVKMGENQFAKMMRQGRNSKLGMVKPTLENPDAIIEDKGGNVDENAVERTSSYIFVKAFAKPDGGRYYYFTSVTVSKDGREVVISNQEKSQKRISKLLRQNPVAWINDKFSSHPITQIEGSVPLSETNKPTQTDNRPALLGVNSPELSEDKGTNHSAKKQASAVETIPTDEKGRPLYHRASVDATLSNINSKGLTPDEVDAFVQANKDAASKLLKKEEDKAPKMVTDLDKYVADKAVWQSRVSDAQAQVDYWNQVADAIQSQRTQVGDATAEDILSMGEPMDGHELAAQMLATGKLPLLQADFKRETGYKGDEARSLFGLFASEANGGMTIERAGEQLMLADQEAGTNFFDQSDPNAGRNAILDVLSEVRTRGDLTNYIRRNREAMAERERQAEYDAYADWCEREMHMTPEEYEAYQEYVVANNPYEGVAVEELDRIFAEAEEEIQTYLNQQDNGQQGTSENGSSPDSGPSERDEPAGTAGSREAGVSVLPEAQPVLPGQVQGRTEGAASQPGPADDGVRAEEGTVSEGASGGEGIENQINDENNEINVVSSQSNQNDTENEQGEVEGISGESSSLDGENEAATILRTTSHSSTTQDGQGSQSKESLLGELAERASGSNQWIDDITSITSSPIGKGGENETYLSRDGRFAIKVNDFSYIPDNSTNFDSFMNRVDAHNELFPNDAITILGFTRNSEGKIAVVLSQPYIGNAREATQEEIDNFLEGMDFYTDMSGNWTDGTFDIADTKPNNVLVDADGNLHFIDVLPYDSRKPGKMLVIPPTRNAFVAPEREEGENLLDYAERVVKTKEIDDARKEVSANPTDAQKEAGNYRKGHITLDGYDITIENPKGSTRSGVDASGQPWSVTMNNDYGYIRGTEGVDGDHIDVFLSDDPTTGKVYVIDQVNAYGSFDEHKVMYGFKSALAAKRAYLANYSPGWKGLGTISEVSKEEFKKWIESSHRKTKPFAEYKSVKVDGAQNDTIKTHQPNALPGRLMKAYESGDTALIASVEQEMREFVNSATDMRSVYSTYLRSKDLERAMEKGSPSNKTQHFIAETCKDVLKKVGLPAKAMQSERARTEFAGSTTDPHVLDIMSADTSFNVLRAIIHNPNTSESTLKHFTKVFSNNGLDYEAQQELDKRQSQNGDELRFREVDVEDRKELVAVHNLSADKLKQAFDLGGFPMPSIAITKADVGHTEFGEISLVFDKESINPTDRRNKVYGEDAWTPTFPAVGYKLNDAKTSGIYRRANKAGNLPLFNPVIFHPDNYENYINSVGSEGLVNHFKDDYGAKQLYLSETGNAVDRHEQHEVDKYLPDQIALYEKMLKEIGIERLKNEKSDALENDVKQLIEEHYNIDFDTMKPFRAKVRISNAIHHAIDYVEHGNRKTETDIEATKKKIDERIDPEKFEAWLENLFSGVVEKKGIRNDKDMFTPSGSSRKWEQLYDDITLDTVVKAMQRQAARGGQGLFNGSIFGAAQEEYKSIDEIRKEARERIRTMNDAEYKAQRDSITDRLSDIKIPGIGDGFSDAMDMAENIQDAVARSHTAKGIHKYLKGFYPKVTMETANEIADIVKDIQRMSARYFEAKPYRAVGFDEVRLAVVPSDVDKKLVQELEQRGIPVRTYERGNEAQRRQIVEEATDEMNLRFREIQEVNERFNEKLSGLTEDNADKVTLDLGNPSPVLLAAGVEDKPMKLYGNKVIKKMKKHGFKLDELRNLPEAVAEPIAVFNNYQKEGNRSILTELETANGNFLVTIDLGKDADVDFNIVTSVFGKGDNNIITWINKGYATYIDKQKTLDYLHFSESNIPEASDNREEKVQEFLSHQSAPIAATAANSELSDATKIVENFENPIIDSEITRNGSVNLSDDALSSANDPVAKMLGKSTRTARQRKEFAERERRNMAARVQELAEKLHLDNVEIVTEPMAITDRQGKTHHPKGFYNPRTGKIVVVVPNNVNTFDAEQTLLHEAVAHYGLRRLFGEHFDTFLDNVFNNADVDVRRKIVELAKKNGWDTRLATEEYLASLAENTNFEDLNASWWRKIKELFLRMLHKIGFNDFNGVTLSDNELRYILWRSYENLTEPGRYRGILGEAADVVKQHELKVGNYAPVNGNVNQVADARESVKAERIRKLRDSKSVEITGNEIETSDDLKQYKKNALEYGKKLQGEYTNRDTGITIHLQRGRRNGGINEVLQHDYKDIEHLQSIAAIPQIIENSIYIDSRENIDTDKNPDVKEYQYYVCGLKIGNVDYTVRSTVAVDKNGNRYYDHKLTHIEKGKLLDLINDQAAYDNGFGTTPGTKPTTEIFSNYKDKILLSILQTNDEENLLFRESTENEGGQNASDDMNDESPSPISTPTVQAWDKLMNSFGFQFSETSFDHLAAVEEFQKLVEKHSGKEIKSFENVYDQMIALSSKTKNEMEMFDSFVLTPMNKAILKLVGEKPVLKRWSWDKGSLRDLAVYVEAKHGVERNRQMAVEAYVKGFNNESLKFFEDAGLDFDREKYKSDLKEAKKKAGDQAYAASYDKNLQRLVDEGYEEKEADEKAKELALKAKERAEDNASEKFRKSVREQLAEQYREKVMADWFKAKKHINGQQNLSWIEKQQMLDEEAGKLGADLSKDYSGLSSIFKDKEKYKDGWNTAALKYVEEYEQSHPKEDIDGLWKSIELATDYALQKQYESGLVSKEYVERQKERFDNYVPLRGFADEIAGDVYNYIGNEFYAGGNPVKTAGGRTSEAGNPFGSILNIAYSSMVVGNKNMAKLALYSLVVNHDTGGLAIPGRAWMVRYDELKNNKELSNLLVSPEISNGEETPEWVEAVPQFPEKATSEEITRAMNNFEEAMKVYQKKGDAKPIGKRAKIPYRTLYKERDQHDIPLFIAGDKYVITVTGNPRLAQAMNGLLNPDVNNDPVSVIGKKIQRFMAGAFTAQNASFAVANLSRDTIYANNQAFIRENFRYWWKFTKNQHLGFGDYPQMMKRLHKYRHNQLDMNNKTDRLFKEFMENGGATGYTFINDQDEYAREIAKQMKKLSRKTPSYITPQGALKLMFDGIEFAGQSAELVNRFAAYKTSREMGRPISRSVRDAKEITVNFNRKGAGMKTAKVNRSTEGKGLIAGFRPIDFVACLSQLGRSHIIFWNANMQGKRRTYLNFKEHPVKTTITLVANNLVLGAVVLPFLNNVVMPALYDLVGWSSGDDDEDYYDALTDWERTKNLCLRLPHGYWLKIPMAPDMSPWLSMGDAIGGSLAGKRELTYSDFAKSLVDVASPIAINWSYGSKHFGLNFVPSVAQPYLQNMMNINFMGNPINKTPFNASQGFIPEYKMVYRSTSPTLIELSRVSNLVTGGSDIKTSGWADWNPAILQNMISGYTGGWGNTMLSIADLMLNTLKGEETSVAMSQVPFVSRFVISGNKDMQLRRVNSSFYKVKDFINEFEYDRKSLENAIREAGKDGNMLEVAKYQDELNQLFNSARCQKYVKLKAIEKGVKSYEEWLNETPNDEMMQDMVIGLKKEGIEELNR